MPSSEQEKKESNIRLLDAYWMHVSKLNTSRKTNTELLKTIHD